MNKYEKFVRSGGGSNHRDLNKPVWYISNFTIKSGKVVSYRAIGNRFYRTDELIILNEDGEYIRVDNNIGSYFLSKPHNWVVKLSDHNKKEYGNIQLKLIAVRYNSSNPPTKKQLGKISNIENDLNILQSKIVKSKFREVRLRKLLDK